MSADLTGKRIRNTYSRLIQKSGSLFYDGLGNEVDLGSGNINTGSFVTTSSFNTFTSSYYTASSSFDDRINNISVDTSHLATTASNTFIGNQIIDGNLDVFGSLTATGLTYPTTDGTDGQVLITDGAGNLSFATTTTEKLHIQVRNDDLVDIPAGTPVYSTGEIGGSERIKVRIAQASDASKMPAIGVVETTLTTTGGGTDGFVIINGVYNENITPTSGTPTLGDTIYVHPNGGLTTNKPSGSNLIQNIGTVLKTNGTVIQGMKISSIDRTNDVPNLADKHIFFGDGVHAPATPLSTAVASTTLTSITASGDISVSGDLFATTASLGHIEFPSDSYIKETESGLLRIESSDGGVVELGDTFVIDNTAGFLANSSGDITARNITATGNIITDRSVSADTIKITNNSLDDSLLLTTTEDSSDAAPVITLRRDSSTPQDGDYLGQLKFKGESDTSVERVYAKITAKTSDVTNGTEDGLIEYMVRKNGTNHIAARLTGDALKLINGTGIKSDGFIQTDGNANISGSLTASNINYPTTDGTNGQVLTTDGSGSLSFTTPSSGGGGSTHTYNLSMQIGVNTSNYYYGNLNYGWNYIIWSSHDTDMALFHTNQGSGMPANDDYTKISLVGHAINTSRAGQTLRYRLWKTPLVFSGNTSMTILAEDDIIMTSQNVYYPIDFNATGLTINKGDLIFLSVNDTSWVGSETIRNSLSITLSN